MKINTLTVGLDVGDRRHTACGLDETGDIAVAYHGRAPTLLARVDQINAATAEWETAVTKLAEMEA